MMMTKLLKAFGLLVVTAAVTCMAPAQAQTTVRYLHTDALGTVVAKTDANGNVVERTTFEPYGAVVGGAVADGPGYTGHVSDAATGLSYMQQRYYDPEVGLFLSADPVTAHANPPSQFNRYRYANGNPYRFVDPDGRLVRGLGEVPSQECKANPACRFAFGDDRSSRSNDGIKRAWRGSFAHKIIQNNIVNELSDVTVLPERRVKTVRGNGSIDLVLRRDGSQTWHVFEIKPISQMPPAGIRGTGGAQVARYVQGMKDEGVEAVPGRWADFFPNDASKWVNAAPARYGGALFGGSYVYGPADPNDNSGIIYYADGPSAAEGVQK